MSDTTISRPYPELTWVALIVGWFIGVILAGSIGYAALDRNTIDVIRIAYKDYPLPNKKTRIVFYVTYRLY